MRHEPPPKLLHTPAFSVVDNGGPPPLDDALVICRLLFDHEPDRYERAAVRWLGRLLLMPSLQEWLSEDHLAWFVLDAVAALELERFYAS